MRSRGALSAFLRPRRENVIRAVDDDASSVAREQRTRTSSHAVMSVAFLLRSSNSIQGYRRGVSEPRRGAKTVRGLRAKPHCANLLHHQRRVNATRYVLMALRCAELSPLFCQGILPLSSFGRAGATH